MAFEEANAQIDLMNKLFAQAAAAKSLVMENQLLSDLRYAQARATIEGAVRLLVQAQDEVGTVPRQKD